ncbi:MAG: alcohol dehydrogenase, propanol-preferring [Acidimicrobiaceae bacterium]|nr:alcohol dehydrogenase, propanol-preferring [Acidimicrobiaceae bacterium]
MKALQLTAWKHEAELVEVPEPTPGPGEVVIRVGGAGACHSDLHLMHDFDAGVVPWALPFTLGHENAGWVEATGSGVTGLSVGDAVAVYGAWGCGHCRRCLLGMENYCEHAAELGVAGGGLGANGGMASLMLVPNARWLVPLGDLDPAEAAPLTDAGLTPYHAVKRSLPLLVPSSTAVVVGAGGLGQMATQLLHVLSPATIIVVDQRPEALEVARQLGADHTVPAGPDAAAEIGELTHGRGAEVVLDVVGVDATMALAASIARPLGRITIVGIGGGTLPISFFTIGYEVSVSTTYWGTLPELIEVIDLAAAGKIRTRVERFALDAGPDVYASLHAGKLTGRAVIVPN